MAVIDAGGLNDVLLAGEDLEAVQAAELEVSKVTYNVPPEKRGQAPKVVLSDVSCSFPPGKLSGIMGATGSGKTSLLTLLRGLSSEGSNVQGKVMCNGRPVDAQWMRGICCSVPQEDVYLSALTAREMLAFAAELRLPRKWTERDRAKRVEWMVSLLKLGTCADSLIGDEQVRGISGGERKRLSVGMAIIGGLPELLLCDEPTSGLDSAAATALVQLIKGLTGRGVTVLCTIHQPSYQLFQEFVQLLLLQEGQTVYCGAIADVEAYFTRHGAPTPIHTNPANHYIQEIQERSEHWVSTWRAEPAAAGGGSASKAQRPALDPKSGKDGKSHLSFLDQTRILTRRTLLENFKNKRKFFRGVMARLPASVVIGLFFWQMGATATQQSIFPLKGVLFVAAQNPLIETFYAGATTFQATKGLLRREYYDGLYTVAPYYLAYYFGFMAMQIPWTVIWVMPMYFMVGLPADFTKFSVFLLVTFLIILMSCAWGSYVGARTKDQEGNRAVLAPMMIPMIIFSGYVIPYRQLKWVWRPIYYLSPVQWALSILERNHYRGVVFEDCPAKVPKAHRRCYATGEEYLADTEHDLADWLGVSGMLLICVVYLLVFLLLNVGVVRKHVLDARV